MKRYMDVYMQIRRGIENGAYPFGAKLPSKRVLSDKCGVSVVTVMHAYELLAEEGYTASRERSGYYVIYTGDRRIEKKEAEIPVHRRSFVETDDFPFSVYAKTMRKVLTEYGEEILVKSNNFGCPELRRAISSYLERARYINTTYERIVIGSGAEYLYGMLAMLFGKEKTFGIEYPSYGQIERVYSASGVKYELLKLAADGIDSDELEKSKADILHITPYRSFPSGVSASASKRKEYILWAKARNAVIIEDDFESEFTEYSKPVESVFSLSDGADVIYINTFSKTVAPSVRMAYMVLPEEIYRDFEQKLGFYSCTVPTFEQYVMTEFINSGDFERHINRIRRKLRKTIAKNDNLCYPENS